jgi:mono/diheme cytochrome c family protein
MNQDLKNNCRPRNEDEPTAAPFAAPKWMIVLTIGLLSFGVWYLYRHGSVGEPKLYTPFTSTEQLKSFQPVSGAMAMLVRSKASYETVCGLCHGAEGQGKPGQGPALAGSEWVTAKNFNRLAYLSLAGVTGPMQVKGQDWNMAMSAMGMALSDESLAGVLTYIRSSWGNQASPVTADDIKKIRIEIGPRPQPCTSEQLKTLPE